MKVIHARVIGLALLLALLATQGTAQAESTTVIVDGLEQSNEGSVNSTGSYTQYNMGGTQFGGGDIPVYQRHGDIQCPVSTFSVKANGLQRHLNQGSLQMGITIPLTGRRCGSAFDDAVEAQRFALHAKQVEQNKQDVLFQAKMFKVCQGMHLAGYVIDLHNPLYSACGEFQPASLSHGTKHEPEPLIRGYGKPAAHESERVKLYELHHITEPIE